MRKTSIIVFGLIFFTLGCRDGGDNDLSLECKRALEEAKSASEFAAALLLCDSTFTVRQYSEAGKDCIEATCNGVKCPVPS
jgi:hypothetical protein